ncbi:2,3-bisphosphoglycerate-dependent phosphoglycerate mutase [archaeon]|jgi:2,3-bisphosphoglycerate-dependent phosphoglycerate mutase|nr:2,3-bisphosphoglycerate-dependent phosphoglycerate mutase [archaeon]
MKCHIYLFRHGETHYNASKKFTGWKDSKLNPQGIKDAKNVAKRLKSVTFSIAYHTSLSRSKDTLKEVLKFHPECGANVMDNRMIERSYGDLQGFSHKSVISKVGQKQFDIWHRSYSVAPPNGESVKMVEKRVNSFIKDLIKYVKKEKVNVAISAHGNSMRPFRKYFEKLTIKEMMALENPWDDYFEYVVDC